MRAARPRTPSRRARALPEADARRPSRTPDALGAAARLGRRPARPEPGSPQHARLHRRVFDDFQQLHGDRLFRDDAAIVGGFGAVRRPAVHGDRPPEGPHDRGEDGAQLRHAEARGLPQGAAADAARGAVRDADRHLRRHARRLPGIGAEERGQSVAIAESILEMSRLPVPIVVDRHRGGRQRRRARAGVADRMLMMENSYYSVISPEGCSTILFKDAAPRRRGPPRRCGSPAPDLLRLGIIDEIVPEPAGGAHDDPIDDRGERQGRDRGVPRRPGRRVSGRRTARIGRYDRFREVRHTRAASPSCHRSRRPHERACCRGKPRAGLRPG